MLTVIKKKGNRQPFDPHKIETTIVNAGNDGGIMITAKEAELMAHDVEKNLIALRGENGVVSSYEIRALIRAALKNFGFPQVIKYFERGKLHNPSDIERHKHAIAMHQAALTELTGGKAEKPTDDKESEEDYDFTDLKTEHYKSSDW